MTTLILLDTGNLHYCVTKRFPNRRINYKKQAEAWAKTLENYQVFAYGAIANDSAYTFRDALRHYGFTVKFKELGQGTKYYNPIVDIVLDVVNHADRVNKIILGSSNQEFLPLINWVKARSIAIGLWACNIKFELQKAVNFYTEIAEGDLLEIAKAENAV